ncbi:hypothetical protein [Nocardia violaceofusca]|nr:hypothetical protein [Nocardia violaceofusca]
MELIVRPLGYRDSARVNDPRDKKQIQVDVAVPAPRRQGDHAESSRWAR